MQRENRTLCGVVEKYEEMSWGGTEKGSHSSCHRNGCGHGGVLLARGRIGLRALGLGPSQGLSSSCSARQGLPKLRRAGGGLTWGGLDCWVGVWLKSMLWPFSTLG